jgi:2',3'-cyclic-nucleotide 3'-phosphodiesterase
LSRETYFTRGTIHLEREQSIIELATQCRQKFTQGGQTAEEVEKWEKETFTPHVSLVYAALDPVPDSIVKTIEQSVRDANIKTSADSESRGTIDGWTGGKIALVS